ncbi:serine--tRNA ligase [Sediminimonas sp.]|uniref:serine--tRNA ligase n=1 Tax=Sediminimonas sp. TaxID=2823379 RepID=UPI0025DD7D7A|nr:serine--tRNA ligase [Sediminimonas sp.]
MHDIRAIRDNPDALDAALARRGEPPAADDILALDARRREVIHAAETAKAEANKAASQIARMIAEEEFDQAEFLKSVVKQKKADIAKLQNEAKELDRQLTERLMELPNTPLADVPDGADEDDNVELHRHGTPRDFDFAAREHYDIAGVKPGMDFETAAKLSGSRFVVLKGAVARIHRALAQFMLDVHVDDNGLQETWTPVLVVDEMMRGTGQLPKFGEDSYQTREGWWLVPTAEVTLTNTVAGDTLEAADLPRRMVAHTQCFRSEAGSAGRDTAGMLRQHQFEKVEMVSITHPDASEAEHARMTRQAEDILERLGLPYRTVVLCTGDMGFGATRTHDIEVWLPGQGLYREISSVSVCGDFQARRMNARFKPEDGGKPQFVHTLNGSGLAVGRCLIAVLENGQQADGSVDLPAALHPYLRGKTRLTARGTLA